jgi:hypothetical protein
MNLLTTHWIPVQPIGNEPLTQASIADLLTHGDRYADIITTPIARISILRLLFSINAWIEQGGSLDLYKEWFDLKTAFQVGGLPKSSARLASEIISMNDGNGVAWSPKPLQKSTYSDIAIALVVSYLSDRGGLKARVPGLPISGQVPLHMGRRIKTKRGNTIAEIVSNNPVGYEGNYQPPWVTGLIYPGYSKPSCELELLLWPWRRLQVFGDRITIAPGAPIDKTTVDPWVIDKASLKHLAEPIDPDYQVTHLVLNQAMPVASWIA